MLSSAFKKIESSHFINLTFHHNHKRKKKTPLGSDWFTLGKKFLYSDGWDKTGQSTPPNWADCDYRRKVHTILLASSVAKLSKSSRWRAPAISSSTISLYDNYSYSRPLWSCPGLTPSHKKQISALLYHQGNRETYTRFPLTLLALE
jgi:hypothetical protein